LHESAQQIDALSFCAHGGFFGRDVSQFRLRETVALLLFSAASLTDYLTARSRGSASSSPTSASSWIRWPTRFLVCSAFIAFVGLGWMPAWMVVIIVARELAITGLRLLAASKNLVLAAEGYGKHKTIPRL